MKYLFAFILSLFLNTALAEEPGQEHITSKVIGEAMGDLDKDGIDEKVIVLDTGLDGEIGTQRTLLIYKKKQDKWALWHSSQGPILDSAHGGMMGDPFISVEIQRGAIVIDHFGGSRQKWSYTHRYRFNNKAWYLIGATINYGAPCEGFFNFDFNVMTGKAIYKTYQDGCIDEEVASNFKTEQKEISVPVTKPIDMDGFYPGSNKLDIKKIEKEIYY
ncbi:hypothetical protein VAWG006_14910 [Aeromonas enteropelogenes]|uniref:Uncharacterized protein n=1 Tax=Aeromonas sp. 19NY04SH05-1 TaxID=2920537 RepID=A0AAU6TDF3_9GAMM|nr:hypothetical protein VAWG006_14910 [Aeromonas enteropelogenes]BEE21402.1 hypothetical protein VAWG007_14970 [Aeromonas enteropelogenes]